MQYGGNLTTDFGCFDGVSSGNPVYDLTIRSSRAADCVEKGASDDAGGGCDTCADERLTRCYGPTHDVYANSGHAPPGWGGAVARRAGARLSHPIRRGRTRAGLIARALSHRADLLLDRRSSGAAGDFRELGC